MFCSILVICLAFPHIYTRTHTYTMTIAIRPPPQKFSKVGAFVREWYSNNALYFFTFVIYVIIHQFKFVWTSGSCRVFRKSNRVTPGVYYCSKKKTHIICIFNEYLVSYLSYLKILFPQTVNLEVYVSFKYLHVCSRKKKTIIHTFRSA